MNPENQDFENLRRLLKLKRYEQPPPRYFSDFSGQVINRIRAGYPEARSESLAAAWELPWLQRVLSVFEAKPILAGAFGAVVVGVLIGGAVYSDEIGIPEASSNLAVSQGALPAAATPVPVPVSVAVGNNGVFALGGGSSSTNPVSIFDAIRMPPAQLTSGQPLRQ
jgi:hypothetical protein